MQETTCFFSLIYFPQPQPTKTSMNEMKDMTIQIGITKHQ